MMGKNVAEMRPAVSGLLGGALETFELCEPPGYHEIGRAFAAVAGGMSQREVVLRIQSLLNERVDVINIKLPFVQHEIDRIVANETPAALPFKESFVELVPLLLVEAGQIARNFHTCTPEVNVTDAASSPAFFCGAVLAGPPAGIRAYAYWLSTGLPSYRAASGAGNIRHSGSAAELR